MKVLRNYFTILAVSRPRGEASGQNVIELACVKVPGSLMLSLFRLHVSPRFFFRNCDGIFISLITATELDLLQVFKLIFNTV